MHANLTCSGSYIKYFLIGVSMSQINNVCTHLHVVLDRGKEELSTEKLRQSVMAMDCQQNSVPRRCHVLDVNGCRLLLIVGSKVLGRMSIAVKRSTLNSAVLKDARGDGSSGACPAESSATVR